MATMIAHERERLANVRAEVRAHLQFVRTVAGWLNEPSASAFWQLHLIIRSLGPKRVHQLLRETLAVEADGGMPIADGKRRRTIGGIFFFLAKQQYRALLPATFSRPARRPGRTQSSLPSASVGSQPRQVAHKKAR